ncbi:hypothetical protein [Occultella kanbiaonis]|nr:hypothetical protein [Occultella kanbiaonis]
MAETAAPSPSDAGDPWSASGDVADPGPSPTSSAGSSGKPVAPKAIIKKAARDGVLGAGVVVHEVAARDDVDRDSGIWLTDDDDAKAIGDPLGNIAARRSMITSAANPDVVDAIAAGVGLVMYLGKQLVKWRSNRQAKAERAAAAATVPTDDGEQLDDLDAGVTSSTSPTAW